MFHRPESRRFCDRRRLAAAMLGPVLPILAMALPAAAADDTAIVGKVVSGETAQPIPFVSLECYRTDLEGGAELVALNTKSLGDGTYRFDVVPGVYRVLAISSAHAPVDVSDIRVNAGEIAEIDVLLKSRSSKVETVEVSAKLLRSTETALLLERKHSAAVTDGIHADQIGRSSDSNAAEVVTRMTGMSVVGGKYVFVRGLGERYSSTTVNGATVGTPEPNRRVLPMDLFPAGTIESIVVQKTFTPDQPGEFGGGIVNIKTRDFPHRRTWSASFSGGHNGQTTFRDFLDYSGGEYDFLGFGGGAREIPGLIRELAAFKAVARQGADTTVGFDAATIEAMGESFNKEWVPRRESGLPGQSFSLSYGDRIDVASRPLGFIASTSLSRGFNTRDFELNSYVADPRPYTEFQGKRSEATTLLGLLFNAGYGVSNAHSVRLNALYNRASEDEVRVYEGNDNNQGVPMRDTRFKYVERGLFSGFIGMDHTFGFLGDSRFDWRINYSDAERNEPDRREYVYDYRENVDEWQISTRTESLGFTRFFQYLDEVERGYGWNWTTPIRTGGIEASIKAGYLHREKERDSYLRRFALKRPSGGDIDLSLPPEGLITDENIGSDGQHFTLTELTRDTDSYRARHMLDAAYGMADFPVPGNVRVVTGVRVEESEQSVVTSSVLKGVRKTSDGPSAAQLHDVDWLPAVNVTWAPTRNQNVRAAFSRTVSRPDLRELSNLSITNYQNGREEKGNPDLQRALITGYDLRWEAFPSRSELLAVSAFYKDLFHPIEKTVTGQPAQSLLPVNSSGATLYGAELEVRWNLGRFAERLESYTVLSNLTLVESEVEVANEASRTVRKRPLQGQSKYVINAGLKWSTLTGTSTATILYNTFGERIDAVGADPLPDIYELPGQSLDFTASHKRFGVRAKLSVENLLDPQTRFEQGGRLTSLYRKGRSISLGLSYGS